MSQSNSLFIGEHEQMSNAPRALFQEDSSSESLSQSGAVKTDIDSQASVNQSDADNSYCLCHGPESGFMVGCEGECDDWFHGSCVGIKKKQKDSLITFICPTCTSNGHGSTAWKEDMPVPVGEEEMPFCPRDPTLPPLAAALPAQPLSPAVATPRIRRARKQLRAMKNTKGKTSAHRSNLPSNVTTMQPPPAPMTLAVARRNRAIREKVRFSHPGQWTGTPGSRGPLPPDDDAAAGVLGGGGGGGGGGNDGGDNGHDGKRRIGNGLSDLIAAAGRHHQATTQSTIQRRTYIDVEETPTSTDILVKKSLEKALFGQQSD